MNLTEDEIIKQCQAGHQPTFRHLVTKYQQMVFSCCLKILGSEEEAKDIVQDTFVKAWQQIDRYDSRHAFSTWLYTIATHRCMDRLKQLKRLSPMPEDTDLLHRYLSEDNALRRLENKELGAIVRVLSEGLGAKQRIVFTLRHLEGLGNAEIEEITGMDAQQVKANLSVARKNIKKHLMKLGYE